MTQPNTSYQGNKLKLYLGSTALFAWIMLTPFVFGPLVIACALFPFWVRYKIANFWVGSILWVAKVCCGIHHEVEGLEHIKDIPAAVVLCKHQSAWETLALRKILPPQTALLKRSLLWLPLWGWALATLKPIAIDRSQQRAALRVLLKKGGQYLNEGLWVVVFPEGTRTAPGEVKKFNAGGAMLAERSGYPAIPIALNSGQYWPRYSFLKYPGTIKVKIGPAIATAGRKANDINAEAEQWIINAMAEL
ncbi:MAG: lysophospholipid acyltransferase family protein [Methylovulum sp.]|nr:lysophospholipid acyltransferase family protein [Methylovulum sp.]